MGTANDTRGSALVTGGSSGIGLALATMLREEGFATTLIGRDQAKLERQAAAIGGETFALATDVSEPAAGGAALAAHLDRWGGLDVLVNNAGIGIAQPVEGIQLDDLARQTNLNFQTPVALCAAAVGPLRESAAAGRAALIINTASLSGRFPQRDITVYSATKAALIAFTDGLNRELAAEGVRATAICPGYVDTPMAQGAKARGVDLGALISPTDCAELARALLRLSPAAVVPEIVIRQAGRSY